MRKKHNHKVIKTLITVFIILAIIEFSLWNLEREAKLEEPYFWGERNLVAYKISEGLLLAVDGHPSYGLEDLVVNVSETVKQIKEIIPH